MLRKLRFWDSKGGRLLAVSVTYWLTWYYNIGHEAVTLAKGNTEVAITVGVGGYVLFFPIFKWLDWCIISTHNGAAAHSYKFKLPYTLAAVAGTVGAFFMLSKIAAILALVVLFFISFSDRGL